MDRIKELLFDKSFVKLGSISPKDVAQIPIIYKNDIKGLIRLFNSSSRIYNTLSYNRKVWNKHHLFIREYWSSFNDEGNYEFRVFVIDGKVIGITQINFHELSNNFNFDIEILKKQIIRFTNLIIKYTSYIDATVDIVMIPSVKDKSYFDDGIFLVEINTPFYLVADSALFEPNELKPNPYGFVELRLYQCVDLY